MRFISFYFSADDRFSLASLEEERVGERRVLYAFSLLVLRGERTNCWWSPIARAESRA